MPGNPWTPGASAIPVGYAPHLRLRVREGRLVGGKPPLVEELLPPDAPTDLACVAVSPSQIDLTWTDNSSNEDGFKIERAPAPGGPFVQIDTVGPDITAYSDGMRDSLTEYCYRVRAFNAAGDSAYSNESCCTTLPTPAEINKQPWPIPLHVPFFTQLFGGYRLGQWWAADGSNELLPAPPVPILDQAAFHFDISALTGFSDGDNITAVPDISGNGCDASISGGGTRHKYRSSGINGLPALEKLSGAFQEMTLPLGCANFANDGMTLIMVRYEFNAFSPALQPTAPLISKYASGARHWILRGGDFEVEELSATIDPTKIATGGDTEGPVITAVRWNPGVFTEFRQNCSFMASASAPAGSITPSTEIIRILADGDFDQWIGFMGETIGFGFSLTDAQLDEVVTGLQTKWGAVDPDEGFHPVCESGDQLFWDDFEGSFAGTLLTAHTPNFDLAGGGWVSTNRNGKIQETSDRNHVSCDGGFIVGQGVIHTDVGKADAVVRGQVTLFTSKDIGFFCRDSGSATLDGIEVILNPTTQRIEVHEHVAGVRTLIASTAFTILTTGQPYDLRVELKGTAITVDVDRVQRLTTSSSVNLTDTKFGLLWQECTTGVRIEDFGVYDTP